MHSSVFTEDDLNNRNKNKRLENEANLFAGAFLLPKEEFSRDVYSHSLEHFINLKKKWKVSIGAMIKRCEVLGILSENQIKYLTDQINYRGFRKKEPLDDIISIELPLIHRQSINMLLEKNICTTYELLDDLAINSNDIERFCYLEKGTLDTYIGEPQLVEIIDFATKEKKFI